MATTKTNLLKKTSLPIIPEEEAYLLRLYDLCAQYNLTTHYARKLKSTAKDNKTIIRRKLLAKNNPDLVYSLLHSTPIELSLYHSYEHYAYWLNVTPKELPHWKDRHFGPYLRSLKFRSPLVGIPKASPANISLLESQGLHIYLPPQQATIQQCLSLEFRICQYANRQISGDAPITRREVAQLLTDNALYSNLHTILPNLRGRFLVEPIPENPEFCPNPERLLFCNHPFAKKSLDNPYL